MKRSVDEAVASVDDLHNLLWVQSHDSLLRLLEVEKTVWSDQRFALTESVPKISHCGLHALIRCELQQDVEVDGIQRGREPFQLHGIRVLIPSNAQP